MGYAALIGNNGIILELEMDRESMEQEIVANAWHI
jgi:hypothetical protein